MNRGINVVLLAGLSLAAVLFVAKPAFAGPTGWTAMGTIDAGTYQRKTGDSTFTKNTASGNGFVTIWKNDSTGGLVPTANFGATDPAGGNFGIAVPPADVEVDAEAAADAAEDVGEVGDAEGMDGGMTGNNDGAGYSGTGESDFENGGKSDTNDDNGDATEDSSQASSDGSDASNDNSDEGDDGAGDDDGGCTDCGDKGFENPDDLWWKGAKNSIYEYTPPDVGKGRVNRASIHEYTPPEGVKQNGLGSKAQAVMVAPSDGDWSNQARRFSGKAFR